MFLFFGEKWSFVFQVKKVCDQTDFIPVFPFGMTLLKIIFTKSRV